MKKIIEAILVILLFLLSCYKVNGGLLSYYMANHHTCGNCNCCAWYTSLQWNREKKAWVILGCSGKDKCWWNNFLTGEVLKAKVKSLMWTSLDYVTNWDQSYKRKKNYMSSTVDVSKQALLFITFEENSQCFWTYHPSTISFCQYPQLV